MINRNKISGNEDGFLKLVQESYSEIYDLRNKAITLYKEIKNQTTDKTDYALLGKTCTDLLKILDLSIDKKLKLTKLHGDFYMKKNNSGGSNESDGEGGTHELTEEDRKWAESIINKNKDNTSKTYQ
jgi:hypothetical protein